MERVRVTQEQADSLKIFIKNGLDLNDFYKGRGFYIHEFKPLNILDLDKLARALYIGYEVEETYEVGDWVHYDNGENHGYATRKIIKVDENFVYFSGDRSMLVNQVRHATPEEIDQEKERRWWVEQGRNPWSLRLYDCLISKNKVKPVVVIGINTHYFRGETTIELNDGTEILKDDLKKSFDVLYFVEDRKDVKE